ncbi:MAG: hypothetical protein CMJ78_21795 [Planctomycetaceae bacterium]|nr:hypothetical protein [Planctomycetaceae bacterium]
MSDYLRTASADQFNKLVAESEVDAVDLLVSSPYFCPESTLPTDVAAYVQLIDTDSTLAGLTASYSPELSLLICPLESHSLQVVANKQVVESVGPFEDVDWPIRQWCLKALRAGFQIEMIGSSWEGTSDADVFLPGLAPSHPDRRSSWLYDDLCSVSLEDLVGNINSSTETTALRAGLLQVNDYLDESHNHSQSIEGKGRHKAGDYWHAIMHRREPDYWNSKYWFRRVGQQALFDQLGLRAESILQACESPQAATWLAQLQAPQSWDSMVFVDFCEHCATSGDASLTRAAEAIQFEEMLLLLQSTIADGK